MTYLLEKYVELADEFRKTLSEHDAAKERIAQLVRFLYERNDHMEQRVSLIQEVNAAITVDEATKMLEALGNFDAEREVHACWAMMLGTLLGLDSDVAILAIQENVKKVASRGI